MYTKMCENGDEAPHNPKDITKDITYAVRDGITNRDKPESYIPTRTTPGNLTVLALHRMYIRENHLDSIDSLV